MMGREWELTTLIIGWAYVNTPRRGGRPSFPFVSAVAAAAT